MDWSERQKQYNSFQIFRLKRLRDLLAQIPRSTLRQVPTAEIIYK